MEPIFGDFLVFEAKRTIEKGVKKLFAGFFMMQAGALLAALGVDGKDLAKEYLGCLEQFEEFKGYFDSFKKGGTK